MTLVTIEAPTATSYQTMTVVPVLITEKKWHLHTRDDHQSYELCNLTEAPTFFKGMLACAAPCGSVSVTQRAHSCNPKDQ